MITRSFAKKIFILKLSGGNKKNTKKYTKKKNIYIYTKKKKKKPKNSDFTLGREMYII